MGWSVTNICNHEDDDLQALHSPENSIAVLGHLFSDTRLTMYETEARTVFQANFDALWTRGIIRPLSESDRVTCLYEPFSAESIYSKTLICPYIKSDESSDGKKQAYPPGLIYLDRPNFYEHLLEILFPKANKRATIIESNLDCRVELTNGEKKRELLACKLFLQL